MKEYLLEKTCLGICFASMILRRLFIDAHDIYVLMLVVNALALWTSIGFILSKGKAKCREKLECMKRDYNNSKSYRKMIIVSRIISGIVMIVVIIVSIWVKEIGDYITIFTLGIALTDDFLADVYGSCFKCK